LFESAVLFWSGCIEAGKLDIASAFGRSGNRLLEELEVQAVVCIDSLLLLHSFLLLL
jgi:hypothetical protein